MFHMTESLQEDSNTTVARVSVAIRTFYLGTEFAVDQHQQKFLISLSAVTKG